MIDLALWFAGRRDGIVAVVMFVAVRWGIESFSPAVERFVGGLSR